MKYDVTIGIPMYNSADYITRTMESALVQIYSSIEFLIIDDASTDNSTDIIRNIQSTHPRGKDINLFVLEKNMGPAYVRNMIIEKAQGDYLFFLDSDDLIREDAISLMMSYVCHDNAEIVFGSLEKTTITGERVLYKYPESHFFKENELANYAYRKYAGIQASACNILMRTSIIRNNNLRFFNSNYWEDFAFVLDIVTIFNRAVLLPDITYKYLCRLNSLSNYQSRDFIDKSEVQRNIGVANYMKSNSDRLSTKPFYPQWCYVAVMTDFYIACNIIKRRKIICPVVSDLEIKSLMVHPAPWKIICSFRQYRLVNQCLYLIGKTPSTICVAIIWFLGKLKKII